MKTTIKVTIIDERQVGELIGNEITDRLEQMVEDLQSMGFDVELSRHDEP